MTDEQQDQESGTVFGSSSSHTDTNGDGQQLVVTAFLEVANEQDVHRFGRFPDADFDLWSRMSAWSCDEAIALSLGKDPSFISWGAICNLYPDINIAPSHISDFAKYSWFAVNYRSRLSVLLNNVVFGELGFVDGDVGLVTPVEFLNWTRFHKFEVPPSFVECIEKHHVNAINWEEEAFRLKQENEKLRFELSRIRANTDEPNPKARSTFQKLILAMAISKYNWPRNASAAGKIVKAVDNLGEDVTLTDDTVRNALKDAVQALDIQLPKAG